MVYMVGFLVVCRYIGVSKNAFSLHSIHIGECHRNERDHRFKVPSTRFWHIYSFWLHLFKVPWAAIYMHLFSLCIHGSNAGCLITGGPTADVNGCRIFCPERIEGWTCVDFCVLGGSKIERVLTFASWADRGLNRCWLLRRGGSRFERVLTFASLKRGNRRHRPHGARSWQQGRRDKVWRRFSLGEIRTSVPALTCV